MKSDIADQAPGYAISSFRSEACPTDCLELTQSFELAVYHRSGFRWDREMLEKGIDYIRYKK